MNLVEHWIVHMAGCHTSRLAHLGVIHWMEGFQVLDHQAIDLAHPVPLPVVLTGPEEGSFLEACPPCASAEPPWGVAPRLAGPDASRLAVAANPVGASTSRVAVACLAVPSRAACRAVAGQEDRAMASLWGPYHQ